MYCLLLRKQQSTRLRFWQILFPVRAYFLQMAPCMHPHIMEEATFDLSYSRLTLFLRTKLSRLPKPFFFKPRLSLNSFSSSLNLPSAKIKYHLTLLRLVPHLNNLIRYRIPVYELGLGYSIQTNRLQWFGRGMTVNPGLCRSTVARHEKQLFRISGMIRDTKSIPQGNSLPPHPRHTHLCPSPPWSHLDFLQF